MPRIRWQNGSRGGRTSLDGRWVIARLNTVPAAYRYLVIERAPEHRPHPSFATVEAAKAYVERQPLTNEEN